LRKESIEENDHSSSDDDHERIEKEMPDSDGNHDDGSDKEEEMGVIKWREIASKTKLNKESKSFQSNEVNSSDSDREVRTPVTLNPVQNLTVFKNLGAPIVPGKNKKNK